MNKNILVICLLIFVLLSGCGTGKDKSQANNDKKPSIEKSEKTDPSKEGQPENEGSTSAQTAGWSGDTGETPKPNPKGQDTKTTTGTFWPWIQLVLSLGILGAVLYLIYMKRQDNLYDRIDPTLQMVDSKLKKLVESQSNDYGFQKNEINKLSTDISYLKTSIDQFNSAADSKNIVAYVERLVIAQDTIQRIIEDQLKEFQEKLGSLEARIFSPPQEKIQEFFGTQPEPVAPPKLSSIQEPQPPEPEVSEQALIANINDEFERWKFQDSRRSYFYTERITPFYKLIALAPKYNEPAFREIRAEHAQYNNKEYFTIEIKPGGRNGHVESVNSPMILIEQQGQIRLKQRGYYYESKQ